MAIRDEPASTTASEQLSFRTLQRLSHEMQHREQATDVAQHASGEARESGDATHESGAPRKLSRHEERLLYEAAQWREIRALILAGIRRLREQEESGFLQSPDLTRAALFAVPAARDVPEAPVWRADKRGTSGKHGQRGKGIPHETAPTAPSPDDASEEAAAWRAQLAEREEALSRRAELTRARRRVAGNTWRRLGPVGEPGGMRPGMSAWPASWTAYLLRFDPDAHATGSGDGWGSALGVALRRVERETAGTPLWTALWAFTEPRFGDIAQVEAALNRGRARAISRRQAYRWVEAGARRVSAEMHVQNVGRGRARDDLAKADEMEAEAWSHETQE